MIALLTYLLAASAHAERKTCLVDGMVCQNCVEMVKKNVCTPDLATCDVKLKDKKKRLGEIAFATKDPAGVVDMKRVDEELAKLTYSVASCKADDKAIRR